MSLPASFTGALICTFCTRNLDHNFHIQCAECHSPEVFLCVDCFSAGVNVGDHENTHSYRVPDCLDMPLFTKDWSIKEELLLLQGVENYGAGNWKTISEKLLPNKTNRSMEEHYWELYLGRHGYCLPVQYVQHGEIHETASLFPTEIPIDPITHKELIADTDYYHVPVIQGLHQRGDPCLRDIGKETGLKFKDRNEALQRIAQLPGADLPGYMPLREDFEIEYENDAENMLADMEFSPDDHPSEVELKLQVIQIYNLKLAERDRRKRFVIDRGLIDVKGQQAKERRMSKEDRELIGKLRVFARFTTAEEYDLLVDGLLKAKRLRHQIELYQLYRQMGFTTLQQVRDYETAKKHQEKELKHRKSRESAPYLFDSQKGNHYRNHRDHTTSSNDPYVYGDEQEDGEDRKRRRNGRPTSRNGRDNEETTGGGGEKRARSGRTTRSSNDSPDAMEVVGSNNNSNGHHEQYQIQEDMEKMRKAPYGDLLSDLELELCVRVPLFPSYYLQVKRALIQEAYRTGMITPEGVQHMLKLQPVQSAMIYDFFIKEMKDYEQQK